MSQDPNESGIFETLVFKRPSIPQAAYASPGDRRRHRFGPPEGQEERRGAPAPPPQPELQWLPGFEDKAKRASAMFKAAATVVGISVAALSGFLGFIAWGVGKLDEPRFDAVYQEIGEQAAATGLILESTEHTACLNESRANDPEGRVRAEDCPPDVVRSRVQTKLDARAASVP